MNRNFVLANAVLAALSLAACSENAADVNAAVAASAQPGGAQPGGAQPNSAQPNSAQPNSARSPGAQSSNDTYTVPRTPWGDPDLTGRWPLESVGGTPMQRPVELGERAYLTDEEYAAELAAAAESAGAYDRETEANKLGSGHWFEWGEPLRQTSLIMEPANGRVPPMTEAGLAKAANMKSSWSEEMFDDLSDFNPLDRCITRGLPASMVPFPYNNGIEIYQSPGYVVLRLELIHETRIVPLDARPPVPAAIENWMGESRGHWEGDTLVIETSHFNGESPMVIVGPSNEPVPTSTALRLTERLTRTGPGTIQYEAWVEDPEMLTAPFKLSFPWTRDDDYEIYEYACHEDNTVVVNYIETTSPRFMGENAGIGFTPEEWLRISVDRFREEDDTADAAEDAPVR